jgi:type II secretory pathway component GspD/PulD (secretin)
MKIQRLFSISSILLIALADRAAAGDAHGLLLNFQQTPLRAVVDYLSDKAGLVVVLEADVRGAVTLTARQPVSTAEAVRLLNDELSRNHYTAVLDGRTLTVMEASGARTNALTPVIAVTGPAEISVNNEIVTGILPVHSLNAAQLARDLEPLIAGGDTVTANEAGNAILMTAPRKDIHRIAAIITALDSTAVSEVKVFTLDYADAKSVAAELKELFQSPDSDVIRGGARPNFGPRFGRIAADGGGDQKEKNAPTRAVFVADEQLNAVAASAPPDSMPMFARVVGLLDKPGQEVTEMEIFPLLHADPVEIADEISSLFAAAPGTGTTEPTARPLTIQFGGPGMLPSRIATESNRQKRQAAVAAVADRRTQSVIVTAAGKVMAQIRKLVARLDEGASGVLKLGVFSIGCADAGAVQGAMEVLFSGVNSGGHTQPQITTALALREQAQANQPATGGAVSLPGSGAGATGLR